MKFDNCIKCNSKNYEIKNVYILVKGAFIPNNELFYLKICLECGYSEMYNPKVVDNNVRNSKINI